MNATYISRRRFLTAVTATGFSAATITSTVLAQGSSKKVPVGLQLYSVRNECAKDLEGTIAKVGKMGYKGVEFAGYHGRDAKTLRKLLDDAGLKCCGTHLQLDTLLGANLARTVEFNQVLGNKFLIVASLPAKYQKTTKSWQEAADQFSEVSDKVKPEGMRVGYHNHSVEFKPVDGEIPWETFFNRAKKDVVIQFDTGNGVESGGRAMDFLPKHPGRVASLHVKPYSTTKRNCLLGEKEDEIPWKEVFEFCETKGGIEWYIIEYEKDLYPPLESVEKTLQNMCRMGKC
jgi:sugar phosphate isomerase/epimerase